jgi:hypothetical protein
MLIEDWRPKCSARYRVQNLSINGRVFFQKDISIIMRMMRRTIQFTFENSKYAFRSPTGMDFHEFDTIPEAKKYVIRHKLSITCNLFCLGHAWGYG